MPTKMPRRVRQALSEIRNDSSLNPAIEALRERASEFPDVLTMQLAGIALHPGARAHFEQRLDEMWAKGSENDPEEHDEIVIGAGLHAAIYCAVRVANGHPKPLVIEGSDRVGGAFAMSKGPAFYLNSRNRPGALSLPGMTGALNVLPEGVVQPRDLSGDEYQRNNDLAFSIRATLAMNADVHVGRKVTAVRCGINRGYYVMLDDGCCVEANRIIIATGLGGPRPDFPAGDRVLTFPQFMATMDRPFPLRGMERVAVIGGGDSGRTAIEALVGQGPTSQWSTAALDFPTEIDWYGVNDAMDCYAWEKANRSRYKGIGRALARSSTPGRVRQTGRASRVASGYGAVYVNERPYTHAIVCTGYERRGLELPDDWGTKVKRVDGREVAKGFADGDDDENVYVIGPAAKLGLSALEADALTANVLPENSTSLFRYADRTATLAATLPSCAPIQQTIAVKSASRIATDATRLAQSPYYDENGKRIYVGSRVLISNGQFNGQQAVVRGANDGRLIVNVDGQRSEFVLAPYRVSLLLA